MRVRAHVYFSLCMWLIDCRSQRKAFLTLFSTVLARLFHLSFKENLPNLLFLHCFDQHEVHFISTSPHRVASLWLVVFLLRTTPIFSRISVLCSNSFQDFCLYWQQLYDCTCHFCCFKKIMAVTSVSWLFTAVGGVNAHTVHTCPTVTTLVCTYLPHIIHYCRCLGYLNSQSQGPKGRE